MSHVCMSHATHDDDLHVSHMNESFHTCEWDMSHICMSHVTHMNTTERNARYEIYEWVISHMWTSHITHMKKSCHTYKRVMSHTWMSHVTHMNATERTARTARQKWTGHVTHMNASCHTFECVMSRMWMRNILHTNLSRHIYVWAQAHIWMSHVTLTYEWVKVHVRDMTQSRAWHDSFTCVTWIYIGALTHTYIHMNR